MDLCVDWFVGYWYYFGGDFYCGDVFCWLGWLGWY